MLKLFFLLLIAELFIGGGGRLFEVGSVTLRMLLFATRQPDQHGRQMY